MDDKTHTCSTSDGASSGAPLLAMGGGDIGGFVAVVLRVSIYQSLTVNHLRADGVHHT